MSVNPSARSKSSTTYCGATQMPGLFGSRTEVVSRVPSAASARGARTRPAAPATAVMVRKPRRVCVCDIGSPPCSRLQLAFEFVQEAPIRAVGDNLLRARLDNTGFVQAQRVEADRVLGVVLPPIVVRDLAQCLQGIFVARRETA